MYIRDDAFSQNGLFLEFLPVCQNLLFSATLINQQKIEAKYTQLS